MTEAATIRLRRIPKRWWFGFQPFGIELDGLLVGKITGGHATSISVPPGRHQIRVKFRVWVWSKALLVDVVAGDVVHLDCGNDRLGYPWFRYAPSIKVAD